jgi:ATP-dependent RNA helicase DHX29
MPRTPAEFQVPPTPTPPKKSSGLDPRAPAFVPSNLSGSSSRDDVSEIEKTTLKSRTLSSVDRNYHRSESGSESPDTDDPNSEYVRLKLQITSLKHRPGDKAKTAFIKQLEAKLEDLKKNYFFDERDAEAQYQTERKSAEALALQCRLRGGPDFPEATDSAERPKRRPPHLQPQHFSSRSATPDVTPDVFDGDGDDDEPEAGMLDILYDMPTTETNEKGITVDIRDMSLPKHWSGRTPKTLLSETVVKVDKYAVISYQIISGASRAKRASVCIRWEGQKLDEWHMDNVACYDVNQAEQYIATIALFALTFPSTIGFAGGASSSPGSQTFFRLLPAVFRDLWDELLIARKRSDEAINRAVWAKLRAIIEPKLEFGSKVSIPIQTIIIIVYLVSLPPSEFQQSNQTGSEHEEWSYLATTLS